MKTLVLGSAAGGGYPQWNCKCDVCALFWQGDTRVRRRTQSSIAISVDGLEWVLLNCSPDIREQIANTKALWPNGSPRGTPIVSIVLTNGDIDHIGGLLSLREGAQLKVFGTAEVLSNLKANSAFGVLNKDSVSFHTVQPGVAFSPAAGMSIMPFQSPGKVPLYLEGTSPLENGRSNNTLGLRVSSNGGKIFSYVPGCASVDAQFLQDITESAVLFFDGTLWDDDEMITSSTGVKTGRRMGHMPVSGTDGSMQALSSMTATRRIFIHLNNTNPLLIDGSAETLAAAAQGWEVSYDGMEIEL
jgi:pyrroloquinoline quinone biosynthesis protein B